MPAAASATERPLWRPAYVGLGSNLEEPQRQVEWAFKALAGLPGTRLELRSSLYRSAPLGPVGQPDFVNAVAGLLTRLDADALLAQLRGIEARMGRPAERVRWGPRIIDLDLLSFAHERRSTPELTLPHPGLVERNFVLYPLAEIAPELELPGGGRVADLQRAIGAAGLTRI